MNSGYTAEQLAALEEALSSERLARYVQLTNGDTEAALEKYVLNTRLSEALYTPLQGLEIALRNAIHRQMRDVFGDGWYDGRVACLHYPLTEMINKAKASLQKDKKPIEAGRMVAELSFGFWVTILGPKYETPLWRPVLRHAFPHRPPRQERKDVQGALNAVRRLRNRVAHHEPILHRNLSEDHELIITMIQWISPEMSAWVEAQSRVPELLL